MKKKYKIILWVVLILAVGGYLAMQLFTPLKVTVEAAAYGPLTDSFTVQGNVEPQKSFIVNSTATGTVLTLPFKAGMTVQEGQELIRIAPANPADLEIQKQQLRQQLATAEYQYQQLFSAEGLARQAAAVSAAQGAYDLAQQQYQAALQVEHEMSGVYTAAQLSELENAVKAAQEGLTAAQAQSGTAASRNYYHTLISSTSAQLAALDEEEQNEPLLAPFTGVVWQLLTDEGSYIIKNQPVLKLYQSGPMKIEASLLSEDTWNLHVDDEASLRLSDGSTCDATVSFISPVAEQVISSLGLMENRCTVELTPVDLPQSLGAGHQVDVSFTRLLAENALSVSASAIVPINEDSAVYVVQGGKAQLTKVQPGLKSGGRVEITAGLNAGDMVITNPYDAGVKDGSRVSWTE